MPSLAVFPLQARMPGDAMVCRNGCITVADNPAKLCAQLTVQCHCPYSCNLGSLNFIMSAWVHRVNHHVCMQNALYRIPQQSPFATASPPGRMRILSAPEQREDSPSHSTASGRMPFPRYVNIRSLRTWHSALAWEDKLQV